ncbi:hypothetical protein QFC19_001968 [Naganishia cerealis]|uniref:Uncharacterized protein n=1 Tax=Naganishia cerealis TaxID=610337 RepID=A0ACC2WE47_9TREE|nr:hypothetical protein QFC19_001968 [Naganishia cerealis]
MPSEAENTAAQSGAFASETVRGRLRVTLGKPLKVNPLAFGLSADIVLGCVNMHYKPATFGLTNDNSISWDHLKAFIANLQVNALANERYKVLFLGRHGLAKHNFLALPPGPPTRQETAREDKGKLLDPELTEVGVDQAKAVNEKWIRSLASGSPLPELWLCSPLTRTAQTLHLSFEGLLGGKRPIFVETYLRNEFPEWDFEEGFSEEDVAWQPNISITSHSCALSSLIMVLHRERYQFEPGDMLAVVVKGTRNGQDAETEAGTE